MPDTGALKTIPNITLIETGTWQASTGEVTFTTQDLLAAVDALQDPAVKQPRLRFGHTKPGVSISASAGGFDSQPCVGKFTNLRVEEDGTKLVGDLVGVPAWLADILPIAYPNRSVEAYFEVNTSTGKHHGMIVASVAVLGEELPAVQTLEDLQVLFSEEGPDWVQELEYEGDMVAASMGGGDGIPVSVRASVDVADVRSAFYDEVATEDSGRYWWWIHQVYIDPTVVIADDEQGDFWLIPYTAKGNTVEFAEPVKVFIQWVETDSGKVAAQASTVNLPEQFGMADAVFASAAASRPADRQSAWNTKNKEARATVPIDTATLAKHLGLSEDASEEQINAALAAKAQEAEENDEDETTEDEVDETETGDDDDDTEGDDAQLSADAQRVAEELKASGQVVDVEQYKKDREFIAKARAKERDDFIGDAVKAGKIPPSRKAHYLSLMEKDEKGTKEFINKLEAGVVPVDEIGTSEDEALASTKGTGLIPELEAARAAKEG